MIVILILTLFSYALNTSRALRPYGDDGKYEYYSYNYAPMNILNELANNYMDLNVLEYKIQGDLEIKLAKGLKIQFPRICTSRKEFQRTLYERKL